MNREQIIADINISFEVARVLPEPFDNYAKNFKQWIKYARREEPPGKCVLKCAAVKSLLTKRREYIETGIEIIKTESDTLQASILGLAGMVLCAIGEEMDGLRLLRKSVEIEDSEFSRLSLALELGGFGFFDESDKICEDVLIANPESIKAKRILAKNYLAQGQTSKAKEMINEVLSVKPKDRAARQTLGDIFSEDQNYEKAISEYKKSLEFFKYKPYIFYRLSLCYSELNKINKSKRYAKKISKETFEIDSYFIKNREDVTRELKEILSK